MGKDVDSGTVGSLLPSRDKRRVGHVEKQETHLSSREVLLLLFLKMRTSLYDQGK